MKFTFHAFIIKCVEWWQLRMWEINNIHTIKWNAHLLSRVGKKKKKRKNKGNAWESTSIILRIKRKLLYEVCYQILTCSTASRCIDARTSGEANAKTEKNVKRKRANHWYAIWLSERLDHLNSSDWGEFLLICDDRQSFNPRHLCIVSNVVDGVCFNKISYQ